MSTPSTIKETSVEQLLARIKQLEEKDDETQGKLNTFEGMLRSIQGRLPPQIIFGDSSDEEDGDEFDLPSPGTPPGTPPQSPTPKEITNTKRVRGDNEEDGNDLKKSRAVVEDEDEDHCTPFLTPDKIFNRVKKAFDRLLHVQPDVDDLQQELMGDYIAIRLGLDVFNESAVWTKCWCDDLDLLQDGMTTQAICNWMVKALKQEGFLYALERSNPNINLSFIYVNTLETFDFEKKSEGVSEWSFACFTQDTKTFYRMFRVTYRKNLDPEIGPPIHSLSMCGTYDGDNIALTKK